MPNIDKQDGNRREPGQCRFYNQVRRYWFREDDYSMPVIARFGTGGGNSPIVITYADDIQSDDSQRRLQGR